MLYLAKIVFEEMDLVWVGSDDIYFVNMRSKVTAPKINKYKNDFTLINQL